MISVPSLEQNQSAFDVENESFSQNFHFIVELHFIDRKRFPIRKISCTWMFRDVKSLPAIGNRRKGRKRRDEDCDCDRKRKFSSRHENILHFQIEIEPLIEFSAYVRNATWQ